MKKVYIDIGEQVGKYFMIYLMIFMVLISMFIVIDGDNIIKKYDNTIDTIIIGLENSLIHEYKKIMNDSKIDYNKVDVNDSYYMSLDILDDYKFMCKYYMPAFVVIICFVFAIIQFGIIDKLICYFKKDKSIKVSMLKFSRKIGIVSIVILCMIYFMNNLDVIYTLKVLKNINAILSVVLIVYGIKLALAFIESLDKKVNGPLKVINILMIFMLPNLYWIAGICACLADVKIIKKEVG